MNLRILFSCVLVFAASKGMAGETKIYQAGSTKLVGYLAQPATMAGKSPAVLIVHDWMGPSDFTQKKADELAAQGYVALAVDIYGEGVRPKDTKEAGKVSGEFKSNVSLLRERVKAGLDTLKAMPNVDGKKIVAFGYCFGGTTVLELARMGADVAGVVSFHGSLGTPNPKDHGKIKGKVMVLHGAIDPWVPEAEVSAFLKSMDEAKVDYQFVYYAQSVHAFTNPKAGKDPKTGAAYNELSDRRAHAALRAFLSEVAPTSLK